MKNLNKFASLLFGLGLLCILVGTSYAFFLYAQSGLYTYKITGGKMSVIYNEITGNSIVFGNVYPLTDNEALTGAMEFEFTVTGYNESAKNIYYAIELEHGQDVAGKNRFLDSDMKLSLYENDVLVLKNEVYDNLNKQDIYYGHITYGTSESSPTINTYKLRMWLNDTVFITNTPDLIDTTGKHVYTTSEFSNSYGSYRVNIKADLTYDEIGYLTYDANGGIYAPKKTSLTTNKITTQKPVLANKGFLGWSSDPLATTPEYEAGDSYSGVGKVLYAVYGDTRNVMSTFLTEITDLKDNITEVYFINDTQANIDTRYGDSLIRADLTYNGQGSVKGWLENDYLDETAEIQYYKLYIGSEGTIYLDSAAVLFANWTKLVTVYFTNADTSNITNMSYMFANCQSLTNLNLSELNTTNVSDISYMFSSCISLTNVDIGNFNTSNVVNINGIFYGCGALESLDISNFDTRKITEMRQLFYGCSSLNSLDLSDFDTSNVTSMSFMFAGCSSLEILDISYFNTNKVTDISAMFYGCNSLINLDVSHFDTQNVTTMIQLFYNCVKLKKLDTRGFNTIKVEDMSYMFSGCSSLEVLDVSEFITSSLANATGMFYGCNNLKELDVSDFDTSKVIEMKQMFFGCNSLTNLDVSDFVTNNVTSMAYMFAGCSNLKKLELSSFNTNNVTDISGMFYACSSLTSLDVSSFDTSKVTDMSHTFWNCYTLIRLDLSSFVFDQTILDNFVNLFNALSNDLIVVVKSTTEQAWILSLTDERPSAWTEANVIIKA